VAEAASSASQEITSILATGIEVWMADGTIHIFTAIHSPDKVWLVLVHLHNDALLGRQEKQTQTEEHSDSSTAVATDSQTTKSVQFQRRNSDPACASPSQLYTLDSPSQIVERFADTPPPKSKLARATVERYTSFSDRPSLDIITNGTGEFRIDPFACTYAGITGTMYAGNRALCFTGKPVFWELLVLRIPWSAIRQIQTTTLDPKNTNTTDTTFTSSSNNSTSILPVPSGWKVILHEPAVRSDGKGASTDHYAKALDFTSMRPNTTMEIWETLLRLHNENLIQEMVSTSSSARRSTRSRMSLQRRNSDPNMASHLRVETNLDKITAADDTVVSIKGTEINNQEYSLDACRKNSKATEPSIPTATSIIQPIPDKAKPSWETVSAPEPDTFTDTVIANLILDNCSLDRFFDLFFANNAPYSLQRFLQSRGDLKLATTDWKLPVSDDNGNDGSSADYKMRTVTYVHPVNAPMAPPQASARKEQSYRQYKDRGIIINTQTYVEDVPMTDCFFVEDRIIVNDNNENNRGVQVTMEFGIIFIKRTMFKSIISSRTRGEYIEIFNAFSTYLSEALSGALEKETTLEETTPTPTEETTPVIVPSEKELPPLSFTFQFLSLDRAFLILVLVLQVWILFDLRNIRQTIWILEQKISNENSIDYSNGLCPVTDHAT
jgi:hypothetical protein